MDIFIFVGTMFVCVTLLFILGPVLFTACARVSDWIIKKLRLD